MIDQVFRSGCGHTPEDEQFDFCPICHISEVEEDFRRSQNALQRSATINARLEDRIRELEAANRANTERYGSIVRELEAKLERVREVIQRHEVGADLPSTTYNRIKKALADD